MKYFIVIILLILPGCASMQQAMQQSFQESGTAKAYATCATADVLSTAVGLATHRMHEVNPLTKALYTKAFGYVMGTVVPVIGMSIAGYFLLQLIDEPALTTTATRLTCLVAIHNVFLIR